MIVPGLVHDHCSAFHPIAAASPYLSTLPLAEHGLRWLQPEIDCAHPLDGGSAGVLSRSIDRTVAALGDDGRRWRQVFGPLAANFDDIIADATQPILRVPRHPCSWPASERVRRCPPPRSPACGAPRRPRRCGRASRRTRSTGSTGPSRARSG
jgi:phytoene dehydrogenase-like protein